MVSHENGAREALRECAAGTLSANVALMQLCLRAEDPDAAREAVETAIGRARGGPRERLLQVRALWRDTPNAFGLVKAIIAADGAAGRADAGDRIARCAAAFDSAAKLSPAASVALYSLGREDLLEKATAEVASYLRGERLLGRDRCALEIGCGIGRFLAALAPELLRAVGLDVSPVMLAQARQRCEGFANVELLLGNGRDYRALPSEAFDLTLAIDTFPYLVAAGQDVTRSNLAEARRVLRPKGRLLIFNYSYRDHQIDRRDVLVISAEIGFAVRRCGLRPFHMWDGAVFDLEKLE